MEKTRTTADLNGRFSVLAHEIEYTVPDRVIVGPAKLLSDTLAALRESMVGQRS